MLCFLTVKLYTRFSWIVVCSNSSASLAGSSTMHSRRWIIAVTAGLLASLYFALPVPAADSPPPAEQLLARLKAHPHKIVCESFRARQSPARKWKADPTHNCTDLILSR